MPRIILYTDLSPGFVSRFHALHQHAAELARQGVHCAPCDPWLSGGIASHQPRWAAMGAHTQGKAPEGWQPWLEQLRALARRGGDILLFGREPRPEHQVNLLHVLQNEPELRACAFQAVFVLGRPACVCEQQFRLHWPTGPAKNQGYDFARLFTRHASAVQLIQAELGAAHITLLADLSEDCATPAAPGLCAELFAALGCREPGPTEPPAHTLRLASREARHFWGNVEPWGNSWPALPRADLQDCLLNVEAGHGWDTRPMMAPRYRAALMQSGEESTRALEEMLSLPGGALGFPPDLLPEADWEPYQTFSDDALAQFIRALPRHIAQPLHQRFVNDAALLEPGQKRMLAALENEAIRRTAPPVRRFAPPELTVLTLAYNQRDYIAQCMDSVLEQKTDFPVQHLVVDHHSTDGTAEIIAAYAARHAGIRPVLLSARRPGQNVRGMFLRCRSPFAALCDGDDYFSDPHKLQTQVNFLRQHPDCAICFHPVDVLFENNAQPPRVYPTPDILPGGEREHYELQDLLRVNFIQTNSAVYRWRFQDGVPAWFNARLVPGDWYWHLLHAETGSIGYVPQRMSVYRRHAQSLYYSSESGPTRHRAKHGIDELRVYHTVNQHFQGRYYEDLRIMAMGVLSDFVKMLMETGDDSLLQQASRLFPDFTKDFLDYFRLDEREPPLP